MKEKQETTLTLILEPREFFFEKISSLIKKNGLSLLPETELYLVDLLTRCIETENLFTQNEEGKFVNESLVERLKEALSEENKITQKLLFQQLGDFSLYISGFFPESLNKRFLNIEYYVEMGGRAYQQASECATVQIQRSVFHELGGRFGALAEVITEMSEEVTPKREQDVLNLYERWISSGSKRLKQKLEQLGIHPQILQKKIH